MNTSFFTEVQDLLTQLAVRSASAPSFTLKLNALNGESVVCRGNKGHAGRHITLWEDIWHSRKLVVESRLLALFGLCERIHGRSTEARRIDKQQAEAFLNANHLQGATGAYYKFGLFHREDLVAVITFSKSRVMTDGVVPYRSYECERFAVKNGYAVTGGLSKLMRCFMEECHPAHLMTYIDRDWSEGAGYRAIGFIQQAETLPHDYFVKPGEWIRHPEKIFLRTPERVHSAYLKVSNSGSIKMVYDLRNYTS